MATFFKRYQAGEHIQVWEEMTALGAEVRSKAHLADAQGVARETMRRARGNVELLMGRLAERDFHFLSFEENDAHHTRGLNRLHKLTAAARKRVASNDPRQTDRIAMLKSDEMRAVVAEEAKKSREATWEELKGIREKGDPRKRAEVYAPAGNAAGAELDALEERVGGPLPLSLRAWWEQVGVVSFQGWHSTLLPGPEEPAGLFGRGQDPLMIDSVAQVVELLDSGLMGEEGEGEKTIWLAPDPVFKAGEGGGGSYEMYVPDPVADAEFLDEHGRNFVEYLRNAFQWAGLPGWEGAKKAPLKEIEGLREGLLEI